MFDDRTRLSAAMRETARSLYAVSEILARNPHLGDELSPMQLLPMSCDEYAVEWAAAAEKFR